MPAFTDVEVTITGYADVDFEVFCGTCGAGLCHACDTRHSRRRQMPQVTVEVCQNCIDNAIDKALTEADEKIEQIEGKIQEIQELN